MSRGIGVVLGLVLGLVLQPAPAMSERILVFAAASLQPVLDELAADWPEPVAVSYASSAVLARQISQGAPADLFLSANADWMDWVEERGAIDPESRGDLVAGRLVLAVPGAGADSAAPVSPEALRAAPRIAMAFVDSAPAGQYGRAALGAMGLWEALVPRVVQSDNARTTLALVARGEVAAGIVYATDALAEPRVRIAGVFDADSHPPIRYPAALTVGARAGAADFLAHLRGAGAQAVFHAAGFLPAD